MFDVTFEINGRKVTPGNIGSALESAILQSVEESVKKSVAFIRCKDHGQGPKIKVKGRNLDSLSFEVTGCCERLIDEVKRKLKF